MSPEPSASSTKLDTRAPRPKVAILASTANGPVDYYLGNQLIRHADVPLILVQQPRSRRPAHPLRDVLTTGPAGLVERVFNRRFEARRQAAMSRELAARLAPEGNAYLPGPRIVETDDVHAPECIDLLADCGANLLFQNGAGIIRRPLIEAFAGRILNVHHGWLPDIRGCHSIAWGLLEQRPEWIGVTVHLIDAGLDTGPILHRERITAGPGDTYVSLMYAATVAGGQLLVQAAHDVAAGQYSPLPAADPGTYRPAMTRRHWLALEHAAPR